MTGSRWKARCGAWVLAGALTLAGLAGGGACQREARAPAEGAGPTPPEAPTPARQAPQAPTPEQPTASTAAPEQRTEPTAAPPSPSPPEAAAPGPPAPAPPRTDAKAPPAEAPPPGPSAEPSKGPSGAQALDLDDLERRLRETNAIGVFTKLALKNDIDDLLSDVRDYHQGHDAGPASLQKLHERFDLLVMKLLSLLQDREPELASRIGHSRQALWQLLADPAQFAKLSS